MNKFSSKEPIQFPLQFCFSSDTSFDNFIVSNKPNSASAEAVEALKNNEYKLVFIWGNSTVGKTHLLQAIFNHYIEKQLPSYFLPFQHIDSFEIDMLENLEYQSLLCIDDIHLIAGHENWEHALFHLFNRFTESGNRLVFSANANAENIPFVLPDLKSRLQWGLTYQLQSLDDDEKILALIKRAEEKQLALSKELASYLLRRVSRDMGELIELLEKLDYASLAEQRKLTIPFVKHFLKL